MRRSRSAACQRARSPRRQFDFEKCKSCTGTQDPKPLKTVSEISSYLSSQLYWQSILYNLEQSSKRKDSLRGHCYSHILSTHCTHGYSSSRDNGSGACARRQNAKAVCDLVQRAPPGLADGLLCKSDSLAARTGGRLSITIAIEPMQDSSIIRFFDRKVIGLAAADSSTVCACINICSDSPAHVDIMCPCRASSQCMVTVLSRLHANFTGRLLLSGP